ncbi:MAG: UMP kinase [Candidatus Paceibacterota bacterium]
MTTSSNDTIIISLGGSLIVPDTVDASFLKEFKTLIESFVSEGKRFFIITGGGAPARTYQQGLSEVIDATSEEKDWIGIHTTRLNAHLVRLAFGELAHTDIILDPTDTVATDKPVVIGAGWKPGWSTDYDAVMFAETAGAKKVLNLSNIEYVYDKDPKKYDDAQKIESISWSDFRKLLPEEWDPGLNSPFDPIAAKKAEELGLEVGILNGKIENIRNYFEGKEFVGTVIGA